MFVSVYEQKRITSSTTVCNSGTNSTSWLDVYFATVYPPTVPGSAIGLEMGEKQQWSNDHLKCLLETCIEEINTAGKRGLSLHKDSWNKLERVLKEKFGMYLNKKQMKNAFDNLKAKYIGWVYLKNKNSNIYNAQTNTFTLTNEEWEEFKKAASLKTVPLPFPDLCAALFDGSTATGNCKWTSTQTTSMVGSSSCHRVQPLLITDTEDDAGTSHQTTSDPTIDPTIDPTFDPTSESTPEPTPEPNPSKRSKTSKSSSIKADDLAQDMQKDLQYLIKGKEGPTVLECSEKLKLVGLDPVDPLFLAVFHIFGVSTDMREAWMTFLDIPDVLRGWIAMTATSLGLKNSEKHGFGWLCYWFC